MKFTGVLGIFCLVGLILTVFGVIDWGARGVALFALAGFVWIMLLLSTHATALRRRP